jgi:hypothetical protein
MVKPLDILLSMTVVYFSVWLYEIGNWISLAIMGANPSLAWSGILPVGVVAFSTHSGSLLDAKLIQVGMSVGTIFILWVLTNGRFPITSVTLAGSMGIYLASIYWEMLSLTSFVPMYFHEMTYAVLCFGATFSLLKALPRISYKMHSLRLI